jgi:dTDP-4-amino-4,6-dideoxygalactose transaminase
MVDKVAFSGPDIQEEDIDLVGEVIRSGWLTHGEYSRKLEELFCDYTGARYAVTVANCTAGLHLSCLAAGFGSGDEVIVPAQTHVATAHAVEYTGAKPIFADVDPVTANIRVSELDRLYSNRTKGVIPVHIAGLPCDLEEIVQFCNKKNLSLIEDCAHALGSSYNTIHVGNFGLSGCFSFYPTKQITSGEGGVVISNDHKVIEAVRQTRAFGITTGPAQRSKPGHYEVDSLGFNYRMTDFQAALALGQLKRYPTTLKIRQDNALCYHAALNDLMYVEYPKFNRGNSYFLFQCLLHGSVDRDKVVAQLRSVGIGTSVHYACPVPMLEFYRNKYGLEEKPYSSAIEYGRRVISLPVHSKISDSEVSFISDSLRTAIEG